jgi:hypothetical protein
MTWEHVTGRPEPVAADVGEFDRTRDSWLAIAGDARDLRSGFSRILSGATDVGFQGQAADAFKRIVRDTTLQLSYVAPVCDDIASVLDQHARRLAELREASRQALVRATTAWSDRARHATERDRAASRVAVIRRQLDVLQSAASAQFATRTESLQWELSDERARHAAAVARVGAADRSMSLELTRHDELSEQVRQLNRSTADRLDDVDPRGLEDPGWFERTIGSVTEWAGQVVECAQDLAAALVRGDFEAALWRIRDGCDLALRAFNVIGPALFALGPIPGVRAAGIAVALLGAGVAAMKFGASAILAGRGAVDVKTGERLGFGDLLVDGQRAQRSLALAALSALPIATPALGAIGAARTIDSAVRATDASFAMAGAAGAGDSTAMRTIEFAVAGVGLGDWDAPLPGDATSGVRSIGGAIASAGPEGERWGGASASDSTQLLLERDIERIRSEQRGFTSGTEVCFVPVGGGGGGAR